MKSICTQLFSLAVLCLIVPCTATLDTRSLVTDALDYFEKELGEEIVHALNETDGVLAQFTMDHKTYSNT